MKTKYAMMVTIKEARQIYVARALKYRRKQGFAPIQKSPRPTNMSKEQARRIRDAVTLSALEQEEIQVC